MGRSSQGAKGISPSSPNHTNTQREISVFWDYENVPLPKDTNAIAAAKAIVDAVSHYGRIVDRRLYFDFQKMLQYGGPSSSLDSCGFDLVNTPTRNQKETLDKKLIADVLTFAWDSAVRNDETKPCVVLITSDGDYAYTLAKLRDRGVMTIVMVGAQCSVASILMDTADVALSLGGDVLSTCESKNDSSSRPTLTRQNCTSKSAPGSPKLQDKLSDSERLVCSIVSELLLKQKSDWVEWGQVNFRLQSHFQDTKTDSTKESVDNKEWARSLRATCEAKGLIQCGRTSISDRSVVPCSQHDSLLNQNFTRELYVRLQEAGRASIPKADTTAPKSTPTSTRTNKGNNKVRQLRIPRIPPSTQVVELVRFLEETYSVNVLKARISTTGSNSDFNMEVATADQASVLLHEANKKQGGRGITFRNSTLGIIATSKNEVLDAPPPPPNHTDDPSKLYYIRMEAKEESHGAAIPRGQWLAELNDTDRLCIALLHEKSCQNHKTWCSGSVTAKAFRLLLPHTTAKDNSTPSKEETERFRKARELSIHRGLIEHGRRLLDKSDIVSLAGAGGSETSTFSRSELSNLDYVRLLPEGRQHAQQFSFPGPPTRSEVDHDSTAASILQDPINPTSNKSKNLHDPTSNREKSYKFIYTSNWPDSTTAHDIQAFLAENFAISVQRIEMENKAHKNMPRKAAHIQFFNESDGQRIIGIRATTGLDYNGDDIFVTVDKVTPAHLSLRQPKRTASFTYRHYATNTSPSSTATTLKSESGESGNLLCLGEDTTIEEQDDPFKDLLWD